MTTHFINRFKVQTKRKLYNNVNYVKATSPKINITFSREQFRTCGVQEVHVAFFKLKIN